jgi:hypothetical protein
MSGYLYFKAVPVRANGSEVATGQVTITPAGPGIFVSNSADPAQPGAVLNGVREVNVGADGRNPRHARLVQLTVDVLRIWGKI